MKLMVFNRIDLKYESSENSCFRILPSFQYQQESHGYIFDEDLIYLMSIMDSGEKILGEPYLHASKSLNSNIVFI